MKKNRRHLLAALLAMPDQAFDWLVLGCLSSTANGSQHQIWPDSLAGFSVDAETAIKQVRKAAKDYLDDARGQLFIGAHQRVERRQGDRRQT
jgi:hypothetical protein